MQGTERLAAPPAVSGADGKFEITGVLPGKVFLRAVPHTRIVSGRKSRLFNSPPAYFPGVLDRNEAWSIDVKAGEIIELDFHLPPVFIGSIKALVSGPDGFVLDRVRVLRPEANQIKNVTVSDEGIGYADSLREGRYAVQARAQSRGSLLAAYKIVHITGGEVTVPLPLEPTARVNGRLVFRDRGGLPPMDNARIVATWTDGTIALDPLVRDEAPVGADGSFSIDGLFGRRTFQIAGLPEGWQVSEVRQGPRDITSSGVDLAPGSAIELSIILTQQPLATRSPEPPPLNPGTSSIHGRVIDALTGKPIEGAEVRLVDTTVEQEKKDSAGRTVTTRSFTRSGKTLTASDGRYTFDGIRAGAYRLLVTHRMYLLSCMAPAAVRGQCDVITVDTDQRVADANMSLTPGGIIRGRVLDKDGQPLEGGLVKVEVDQPLQGANSATTGADGRFEISSVPPGQMLVRVDPPAGPPAFHRTMYYPGVPTRDEAQPVTIEIGRTVEIELRLRDIPVATIRATLSGPEGFRVRKMTLVNPDTRMLINMRVSDEGAASVTDLDEGRYAIAVTATAGSDTLAAHQLIVVGAGDYDVPMQLEPIASVAGRVVVDRGGVPPVDGLTVEAHWVSDNLKLDLTGPERISVAPDGSFTMRGLYGRRQFHLFGLSDQWRVSAVRAGRADVTSGLDLAPGSAIEISIVVAKR